ncbi:hypothetical protein J437_LFUL010702 [Ladona fulva]|uniref:HotDog ACOT-type domain-containing protein n=1 Tax=Ladona fulva TaxID=123851 RepID=A0A8K0K9V5_LADFU|nr:hypothetical protein J437_LFUL010702 [Ladona fulva]
MKFRLISSFLHNRLILLRNGLSLQFIERNPLQRNLVVESQEPASTVHDVRQKLVKHMGLEHRGYQRFKSQRDHLLDLLPKSRSELPVRRMQDSYDSTLIPLGKDLALQERYISFLGHIRTGRLMEDLDIFAVWLTHRHLKLPHESAEDQPTPYVIVTVLVDQIDFTDLIPRADQDIRMSGHVSWVGSSSMETTVWMDQRSSTDENNWKRLTTATFLMAARDSNNEGPALVNPLEAVTDEEKRILQQGEKNKQRRQTMQKTSLYRSLPSPSEQRVIHDIFLKSLEESGGGRTGIPRSVKKPAFSTISVAMKKAAISNMIFCHPEDRNLHNKVFGGFLMRQALELAWTTGYMFSKFRPKLCHISNIGFHCPVDVGSLLGLSAYVCYTEQNYMQISVYAEVFDPRTGRNVTTNDFHYTFSIPEELPEVVPESYHECMMYLDGRRRFQHVMGLKSL